MIDASGILIDLGINPVRQQGDELVAHCPLHTKRTGKPDSHPSWYFNTERMVFICFSCQYTGTLIDLFRDLGQTPPDNLEWEVLKSSAVKAINGKVVKEPRPDDPVVNDWTLHNVYVDVPQRLLDLRNLTRAGVDHFEVRWDKQNKRWVIPIRSADGALLGYQYRVKGLELNYPESIEKSSTLFGFSVIKSHRRNRIIVVESPLDAVRLHEVCPAVATMGVFVSDEQLHLLACNFGEVVIAFDNDKAGKQASEILTSRLHRKGCLTFPFDYTDLPGKDPGEEPDTDALRAALKRTINQRRKSNAYAPATV